MVTRDVVVVAFGRRRDDVDDARTRGLAHCSELSPDTLVEALSKEHRERLVGDDLGLAPGGSVMVGRIKIKSIGMLSRAEYRVTVAAHH